jgi:hypothetical protein
MSALIDVLFIAACVTAGHVLCCAHDAARGRRTQDRS